MTVCTGQPKLSVSIEKTMDWIFHTVLVALPDGILRVLRPLKTERNEIAWTVIYILLPFILIILAILIEFP